MTPLTLAQAMPEVVVVTGSPPEVSVIPFLLWLVVSAVVVWFVVWTGWEALRAPRRPDGSRGRNIDSRPPSDH